MSYIIDQIAYWLLHICPWNLTVDEELPIKQNVKCTHCKKVVFFDSTLPDAYRHLVMESNNHEPECPWRQLKEVYLHEHSTSSLVGTAS